MGRNAETVIVFVNDDNESNDALQWSLKEFSDVNTSKIFLLLHVVTQIQDAGGVTKTAVEATQQQVAEHVVEKVLPFLEGMQDVCDELGAESSIEVVKSNDAPNAIIDAACRLHASTVILPSPRDSDPNSTAAKLMASPNSPFSLILVSGGRFLREIPPSTIPAAPPQLPPAPPRLDSSLLGLVEAPEFRSSTASGEFNRENWQKRQATRSGKLLPNGSSSATTAVISGNGDRVPSALQMARLAYRAGKPANPGLSTVTSDDGGSSEGYVEVASSSSGGGGPVEFAMPPPSVTRSSKMSGKLTAAQKMIMAKGGERVPLAKGTKLDPKDREARERAASHSIRVSMGQRPVNMARLKSANFKEYTVQELKAAMDQFYPSHILGEGSYGIVYRGLLDGEDVAIKQLKNPDTRAALEEIDREIEVQRRCDHPNLVKLLGYSIEDRSLVYEYLSNGSVEDRLLCMGGTPPLLWPDRCRIAMETAAALLHLHTRDPPIVHRDVKPANVLLDDNFQAKLGDVGLARLMQDMANGNTHIVRKSVIVGTEHYVDPEYLCARRGYLGPKSDVYSFGIVVLQMLVGGIPNLRKIDMAVEREELGGLLDPKGGDWPVPLAMDLANLGLWCSEMDRRDRPDLEQEVIPALLEICEAAAMEVVAREEVKAAQERKKNEEVQRILEEEKAAKAAQEEIIKRTAAASAAAATAAAAATLPPVQQTMNKSGRNGEANSSKPAKAESSGGCC